MSNSPELKVVLFANNVEVAVSTDGGIWLQTMASITGVQPSSGGPARSPGSVGGFGGDPSIPFNVSNGSVPLEAFAAELGVSSAQLTGAASPSPDAPYIHLDHKYWEAIKQNTPPRGVGSVSGSVLAATLLLVWNRHAKFGKIVGATCDAVLATVGHEERNRARSLKGCEWIQVRDDGLRLNPANTEAAIRIARAYVTKTAPK